MSELSLSKGVILTDRSRCVVDWLCQRKRFLNYHVEGTGVVSSQLSLDLFIGSVLHDGLAAIATQHRDRGLVDIDLISTAAAATVAETLSQGEFAKEQTCLIEGLLRGFYRHVWPRLTAQYPKIIAIEQEMVYQVDDKIRFMSRPDLILEDASGEWIYIEYKSTSSKKEDWTNSWSSAVQLHSTIKAVEATLGKAPASVIVVGLYKGFSSYGKFNSPLVYGYLQQGQPPFFKDKVAYEYTKGYLRTPVWSVAGGCKGWVAGMRENILAEQFPMTPPIFIRDGLVEAFYRQLRYREYEIRLALQMLEQAEGAESRTAILDTSFPQNWAACNPGYNKGICEYMSICHGSGEISSTAYQPRVPHHPEEAEALDNA